LNNKLRKLPSPTSDPTKGIQHHQMNLAMPHRFLTAKPWYSVYNHYNFCTAPLSSALAVGITTLRLRAFVRCVSSFPGLTDRCVAGPALLIADLEVFPTAVTLGCVVLSAKP